MQWFRKDLSPKETIERQYVNTVKDRQEKDMFPVQCLSNNSSSLHNHHFLLCYLECVMHEHRNQSLTKAYFG